MEEDLRHTSSVNLGKAIGIGLAATIGAIFGSGAAALATLVIPQRSWTWAWVGVIVLGLIVQEFFGLFVATLGTDSRLARASVIVATVAGFCCVWFLATPI